jgi:mono/diheme cytochrome c family protein
MRATIAVIPRAFLVLSVSLAPLLAQTPASQQQQPEFIRRGQQLMREGNLDDALALYRKTLQISPNSVPANIAAGSVLDRMSQGAEAREYLVKAIQVADTQTQTPEQQQRDVEVPAMTPAAVGQKMFRAYCASCHGLDGKGKGPAAPALKKQPSDLTLLSKRKGGRFPRGTFSGVIEGNDFITDHGSRDMPIWGDAFRTVNRDESMVQMKVHNLTIYIESIQQK